MLSNCLGSTDYNQRQFVSYKTTWYNDPRKRNKTDKRYLLQLPFLNVNFSLRAQLLRLWPDA